MQNKLTMKYPSAWHGDMWREAAPFGNGVIGGMVYGIYGRNCRQNGARQLRLNLDQYDGENLSDGQLVYRSQRLEKNGAGCLR